VNSLAASIARITCLANGHQSPNLGWMLPTATANSAASFWFSTACFSPYFRTSPGAMKNFERMAERAMATQSNTNNLTRVASSRLARALPVVDESDLRSAEASHLVAFSHTPGSP
jgi:hypothetical protein